MTSSDSGASSILQVFSAHDRDGSGTIKIAEFMRVLQQLEIAETDRLSILVAGGLVEEYVDYREIVEFIYSTSVQSQEDEAIAQREEEAHLLGVLTKMQLGIDLRNFAMKFSSRPERAAAKSPKPKKNVLCIIDVMDGYDGEFLASLPDFVPGGLSYIQRRHPVPASFELESGKKIRDFAKGEHHIRYDKMWNRGLNGSDCDRVAQHCIQEIRRGYYDFIVFTYDYLEKYLGEEKGIFALDDTPWSDPRKPVAHVAYGRYLTIDAGGVGTDISQRIRKALPEVTNARGPEGQVCGTSAIYFRKQVDDAFCDHTEKSERTMGEEWLDDVDVDDNGLPKPGAETLLTKLSKRWFGPDEAVLSFCGVLTDQCVASSLLHAVEHGYNVRLLEGGCSASNDEEHKKGVAMIMEKGGDAVEKL